MTIAAPVKTLSEKAIALDMLLGAKQLVGSYSRALNESQDQQLRSVLETQLRDAIHFQESVAQFAIQQGYYAPQLPPQQLVQQDIQEAMRVIGQANQSM
ncbi:spore coat protein [Brevibacillus sp. SYP-B805]|uniref:spore coat protein n=1 Tax=Brevibacillus sp. SYP-B805 TaxID=1578199 RepID=UPI0013ECA2C9|nr:spore coat protein [Brevibacillus sp. SYP-B805]NGQ97066.1 spore coat protein [Brevibacillus sp. SYP-B805]